MSIENYFTNNSALCYRWKDKEDKEQILWLSSPFKIEAYFCDEHDNNYGYLLSWHSQKAKQLHKWCMPASLLASDGKEIFNKFLSEGIEINYNKAAKAKLLEYIAMYSPAYKLTCIDKIGWYKQNFVLPNRIYPKNNELLLRSNSDLEKQFGSAGTLLDWQNNIAKYAQNNARLILALSCAFAAPLLHLVNEESGAIHLVGNSSLGKTTALQVASSVWGSPSFIKQWRMTCNALEVVAQYHSDCLLPLDELAQADSKSVSDIVYMLANNEGKRRLKSEITLRSNHNWRTLILSTGEIDIATKVLEASKKAFAGMEVRFVSIPARYDDSQKHGIFEYLHGFASGEQLSRHLKEACSKYYGAAIQRFLECLTQDILTTTNRIKQMQHDFKTKLLPTIVSGQVSRVASRFGLLAAAGELAIEFGILPLAAGSAVEAMMICFQAWLSERGNTEDLEQDIAITQVKSYLEKFGDSKFVPLGENSLSKPLDRAGYKQKHEGVYHYYVLPETYKNEVCKGLNHRLVTKYLLERDFLKADNQGKNLVVKHLPDVGKIRVYHLTGAILS